MTLVALVLLAFVVMALLYDRYETGKAWARERERLLNAAIANNARELSFLNYDPPVSHEDRTLESDLPEGL